MKKQHTPTPLMDLSEYLRFIATAQSNYRKSADYILGCGWSTKGDVYHWAKTQFPHISFDIFYEAEQKYAEGGK